MSELDAFALQSDAAVPLGTWPALEPLGLDAAVTTRHGGVSEGPYGTLNLGLHVGDDPAAVAENRRRAARAFGADPVELVFGQQVHGAQVAVVGLAERGRGLTDLDDAVPSVDALVTVDPGVVLVTLVADCVPIVLFDPEARVLASVHAGWRGTVADITASALEAMIALGARPERVVAAIGPCVAPQRYQVDQVVAEPVRRCLGAAATDVLISDGPRTDRPDHWRLDLAGANHLLLQRAGVDAERIAVAPVATGDDSPFFSDRAARPCGRFALLSRLRPYDGGPAAT